MKSRIYLLLFPAVLLLHSCGLYRNYKTPAVEYNTEVLCSFDTVSQSVASLSWRNLFTDSLLVDLIDSALVKNTDLRMAQLKTKEAAATLTASRLAFLPSLSLKAEGGISNTSPANFTIAPSVSWEIDIFGKQRNLKEGAKAAFYASEAYRQAVQTQLIATVASSYFTLLMLDEQLSISERTLKTWDENIRALQALKRAGRTNEAIVLQARANRIRVENSVLTLRNQISVQENAMKSLLLSPDLEIKRGLLNEQVFPDSLTEGIPLEYLSKRPDVREAEFRLENAFYNVNVARAAFYPTLT
ncbi:MAG: TolC family protein, partial [Bacteroidales bacterium]|nr:TolC family protein [Bacteroidales bacterium]